MSHFQVIIWVFGTSIVFIQSLGLLNLIRLILFDMITSPMMYLFSFKLISIIYSENFPNSNLIIIICWFFQRRKIQKVVLVKRKEENEHVFQFFQFKSSLGVLRLLLFKRNSRTNPLFPSVFELINRNCLQFQGYLCNLSLLKLNFSVSFFSKSHFFSVDSICWRNESLDLVDRR